MEENGRSGLGTFGFRLKNLPPEGVGSRIKTDVFWSGPSRLRGGSEVALMEDPNLVRRESPNDGVQNTSIVEDYEVLL